MHVVHVVDHPEPGDLVMLQQTVVDHGSCACMSAGEASGAFGCCPCCCRQVSPEVSYLLYLGSRRCGQNKDP